MNRDTVDRAWENGASRTYADYRPRQNAQTPPAKRQGRPSPAFNRSESPQNRRPYEPRQESYRGPSSGFRGGYQQRREQSPEPGPRRFNQGGQRAPAGRPSFSSERWSRNSPPQQRGYAERYQDERPPRFGQDRHATARPGPRTEHGPRSFERTDRERESFARGRRTSGLRARRDNSNPRWQSRPATQRTYQARPDYPHARRDYPAFQQEYAYDQPGAAQFEGDYEHFDTYQQEQWEERSESGYEKHVTRLPDGRVLKGSRPSQRKQARFWNNVEEETSSLMPQIAPVQKIQEVPDSQEKPAAKTPPTKKQAESMARKVKTVKTTRARDAGPRASQEKVSKKKGRAPQGTVTRPFQRGYKWPTAGGE